MKVKTRAGLESKYRKRYGCGSALPSQGSYTQGSVVCTVTREGSRRQTLASPQCCDRKVQNAKSDPKTTYHLYVEDCIDAKGNLVDLKDSWPKIYFVTLRPPGPRRLAVPG